MLHRDIPLFFITALESQKIEQTISNLKAEKATLNRVAFFVEILTVVKG
jgi:hypothetical protein